MLNTKFLHSQGHLVAFTSQLCFLKFVCIIPVLMADARCAFPSFVDERAKRGLFRHQASCLSCLFVCVFEWIHSGSVMCTSEHEHSCDKGMTLVP